jgi:hypothetical protein
MTPPCLALRPSAGRYPVLDSAPLLAQARERVRRQNGGAVGRPREELITPALVLDIDAAQRNIDGWRAGCGRWVPPPSARTTRRTRPRPRVAPGPGGRGRAVDGDGVGGGRAGGRRPGRPVRGQHRVTPGQDRRAGPAGRRSPDPGRGGRGAERRRPVHGGHGGRLRSGSWSRWTPGWTGAAPTPRSRPWPWPGG